MNTKDISLELLTDSNISEVRTIQRDDISIEIRKKGDFE